MNFFSAPGALESNPPFIWFRIFSHAVGHASWQHLMGNLSLILLLGPMLEEKYGPSKLAIMCFLTAGITGLLNVFLFPHGLLGASGIAFMMILLGSFSNYKGQGVPVTFLLICLLFLGKEIVNLTEENQVSEFAHLLGGGLGALFGFRRGT
jgi:membrane associated rhomboid family serine protease